MLAVLLAGAALAGYYAWSDKQPANPSLPAKINENGPVFILVAIEIILCLTAAIFLFCTRTIRRSLLAKIISILFSIALFVLGVEMWRNKFQDVDYCNVATDLGNQLGQDNGKNYHDYIWLVSGLLALLSTLIASFK